MFRVLTILLCILCLCPESSAQDTVTWYRFDQPPFYSKDQQGIHDKMVDYLISQLPEYGHTVREANIKRALESLAARESAACLGLYKTSAREKRMMFNSIPLYLNPNTVLVCIKERYNKIKEFLGPDQKVDVERLLSSGQVIVGVTAGRQYSGVIDRLLEKHRGTQFIYERHHANMTTGFMHMLVERRIDAYFEVPFSVASAASSMGVSLNDLVLVPISGMPVYEPVYVGLPQSDMGRALGVRIDEILEKPGAIGLLSEYIADYLNSSLRKKHAIYSSQYYKDMFGIDVMSGVQ